MSRRVLVLGGTGTLGKPVVRALARRGHEVRILARSVEKARRIFEGGVETAAGDSTSREELRQAVAGCDAVHVSLPAGSELVAVRHLVDLAAAGEAKELERISYVSATSATEENRWFDLIDVKLRAEEALLRSGIPHTVFCPTWVMEVLPNFVKPQRAVLIQGKNPPGLHFFAATDFGRMVAESYEGDGALSRRLFIHGPEAFTLPEAIQAYHSACHPEVKLLRLGLWKARLIARLSRQKALAEVTRLIAYFDQTEEHGDPSEANALLGAPSTTLAQWIDGRKGGF